MNRLVRYTRLPAHEQVAARETIRAEFRTLAAESFLTRILVPATEKISEACHRKTANVRALLVLVAVERYRLKKGGWPGKLEELKPGLLAALPLDPYDGKPLRYARRADGVTVYSVGPDGIDDGGKIDRSKPLGPGTDLGFRLWDVKARRQALPPGPAPGQNR
jgi:hypothetical protein